MILSGAYNDSAADISFGNPQNRTLPGNSTIALNATRFHQSISSSSSSSYSTRPTQNGSALSATYSLVQKHNTNHPDKTNFSTPTHEPPPILLCPCNCTFINFSCCFATAANPTIFIILATIITNLTLHDPPLPNLVYNKQTGKWKNETAIYATTSTNSTQKKFGIVQASATYDAPFGRLPMPGSTL